MAIIEAFQGILYNKSSAIGIFHFVDVPFDIQKIFGRRTQIRIKGTLNGVEFVTSLLPRKDGEFHFLIINKEVIKKARIRVGEKIQLVILDEMPPFELLIPEDLELMLEENPLIAKMFYEKLLTAQRKYIVEHIESAKKLDTRINRLSKIEDLIKKMYSRRKATLKTKKI